MRLSRTGRGLLTGAVVLVVAFLFGCDKVDKVLPGIVETYPTVTVIPHHINAVISENHGHKAVLHIAQVERGEPVKLPVYGAPHTHTVDLSSEQLAVVGEGKRVNELSSAGDGHTHWMEFYAPYLADM